jgi:lipopolysaccharide transport system ATP-binding protein
MPAIEVSHLTKEYRLGAMQSMRQIARRAGARLMGRAADGPPPFKALDDVSFSVEPGEVVGIIGHNGAGKSTLLKMLARITTPTSGSVHINGRIAPLIEVGAGFVGDFTGRENVYLNGAILGMSKKEIDRKFDEIVDFAEMAEFIDTPVKRYSSGMQVKLAFAVATSIESEILIVDEVLAVGDLAFQRKCFDRMEQLIKREQRTVLLVSHNIRQVERLCGRVIVMERGHKVVDDLPQTACNHFYQQSDRQIAHNVANAATHGRSALHSTGELELLAVELFNAAGFKTDLVSYSQPCRVQLTFRANRQLERLAFGLGVHTADLLYISTDDSILSQQGPQDFAAGEFSISYRVDELRLFPGTYAFRVGVAVADNDRVLFYNENLCHFQVDSGHVSRSRLVGQGFFSLAGQWAFEPSASSALSGNRTTILHSSTY